jgi:hypothetical protein
MISARYALCQIFQGINFFDHDPNFMQHCPLLASIEGFPLQTVRYACGKLSMPQFPGVSSQTSPETSEYRVCSQKFEHSSKIDGR